MTQKFWVSTGLIKIARAFYKLVLFILLCQKKKRSFRSLLVSLFIKIHVCSIEFYEQFTCQTMSTASTSTRNPQRSSVKQFRPLYASLPNVFIAANSVDVTWGHISVVQAQFSCMEELLKSQVKWKYYISLVGQDFPLYDNKQIVKALQGLNNTNNIASFPMMDKSEPSLRTKFVYIFKQNHKMYRTNKPKGPSPHNITIYKGSTHIIAIREFVEFGLHGQIGKDFYEFLKDSKIPDETILFIITKTSRSSRRNQRKTTKMDSKGFVLEWGENQGSLSWEMGAKALLDYLPRFKLGAGRRK